MTQEVILYIIIAIAGILVIFSFAIGIEKMIKIILWNYILSSICRAATASIGIAINYLATNPEAKFLGMGSETLTNFLSNGKSSIVLILYIILIVIIYRKSRIRIHLPMDEASKKMMQITFVPLTVLSIILTLQIALMGMDVTNIQSLTRLGETISTNPYIIMYFSLTPIRILLHGIITILFTTEMKISVETDSFPPFTPTTPLPPL